VYPIPESGEIAEQYAVRALPLIVSGWPKPGFGSRGY